MSAQLHPAQIHLEAPGEALSGEEIRVKVRWEGAVDGTPAYHWHLEPEGALLAAGPGEVTFLAPTVMAPQAFIVSVRTVSPGSAAGLAAEAKVWILPGWTLPRGLLEEHPREALDAGKGGGPGHQPVASAVAAPELFSPCLAGCFASGMTPKGVAAFHDIRGMVFLDDPALGSADQHWLVGDARGFLLVAQDGTLQRLAPIRPRVLALALRPQSDPRYSAFPVLFAAPATGPGERAGGSAVYEMALDGRVGQVARIPGLVHSLAATNAGGIYVGTRQGIRHLASGSSHGVLMMAFQLKEHAPAKALPGPACSAMALDPEDEGLYFCNPTGIYHLAKGEVEFSRLHSWPAQAHGAKSRPGAVTRNWRGCGHLCLVGRHLFLLDPQVEGLGVYDVWLNHFYEMTSETAAMQARPGATLPPWVFPPALSASACAALGGPVAIVVDDTGQAVVALANHLVRLPQSFDPPPVPGGRPGANRRPPFRGVIDHPVKVTHAGIFKGCEVGCGLLDYRDQGEAKRVIFSESLAGNVSALVKGDAVNFTLYISNLLGGMPIALAITKADDDRQEPTRLPQTVRPEPFAPVLLGTYLDRQSEDPDLGLIRWQAPVTNEEYYFMVNRQDLPRELWRQAAPFDVTFCPGAGVAMVFALKVERRSSEPGAMAPPSLTRDQAVRVEQALQPFEPFFAKTRRIFGLPERAGNLTR